MLKFTRFSLLLTCVVVAGPTRAQQQDFPGIEQLMTAAEFEAMGLDQLSKQQRRQLNRWLAGYLKTVPPGQPGPQQADTSTGQSLSATPGTAGGPGDKDKDKDKDKDTTIRSRIAGSFKGWSGKTRFRLENGQLWRQRYDERWQTELDSPQVEIRRNFFGFYYMELPAEGRGVGVTRVK